MTANFDRGVFSFDSVSRNGAPWHKQGKVVNATNLVPHAYAVGAWPESVSMVPTLYKLPDGSTVEGQARGTMCVYSPESGRPPAINGEGLSDRYHPLSPSQWDRLNQAATDAGAIPDGAFSLVNGSKRVSSFALPNTAAGKAGAIANWFLLSDSFDGSSNLMGGATSIRVVCTNTLASAIASDGRRMGKVRHTASIDTRAEDLHRAIVDSIQSSRATAALMARAADRRISGEELIELLADWYPLAASATDRQRANVERDRAALLTAAKRPENRVGEGRDAANLATLWNAATFLIDRETDGSKRAVRGGGSRVDSIVVGAMAREANEVLTRIRVLLRDGSETEVDAREAVAMGVAPELTGRAIVADLLGEPLS